MAEAARHLDGIRGWLILPALGLVVSFARHVQTMLSVLPILSEPDVPGQPLFIFEMAMNGVLVCFVLVLLVLFFQKRRLLPLLYIIWLVAELLSVIADTMLVMQYPIYWTVPEVRNAAQRALIGALGGSAIWITYFLKSKRVAATFVR